MNPIQSSNSVEFAAVLLDAWDRADISSLSSHLAKSDPLGSAGSASSLEGERCELVSGIAASLRHALTQKPTATAVDEMDTSVQLLRHLVRMQGCHSSC